MIVKNKLSGNTFFVREVQMNSVIWLELLSQGSCYGVDEVGIQQGQVLLLPRTAAGEVDQSYLVILTQERLNNDFEVVA